MEEINSYTGLSKVLSPVFLDSLADNDLEKIGQYSSEIIRSGLTIGKKTTFKQALELCYSLFCDKYRNEYVYKNAVFQELVMKHHSFKDCVAIPEFRVGVSKADLAVFNGTSTAYEIKTELDTLNRLIGQLEDYIKFFDMIYIVTHQRFVKAIEEIIPKYVGLYVLDESLNLVLYKEAESNKMNVSNDVLMASLRKSEYASIIEKNFGEAPNVPNGIFYNVCKELFRTLNGDVAHDAVVHALKSRRLNDQHIEFISKWPECLKSLSLTKRYNTRQWENIEINLNKTLIFS